MFDHPYSAVLIKDPAGSPRDLVDSPQSFKGNRASLLAPDVEASLKHHPNNSLGLTIEVARRFPDEITRPLSTGKSDAYSIMSSRVVTATRLKAQAPSERERPQLYIVTSPAVRGSGEQSTLDISPPLRSRFSLPTTKSVSPSTISYPNTTIPGIPDRSDSGHEFILELSPETVDLQLSDTVYSDDIQHRRSQRMSSVEHGSRPLPPTPW
ncbi:hypothetical protein D9758_008910 [Tetrapyrgos nigripes]|uniref:Uncharacterized protein n=1 Tax=Tetrapyrgos nigripes TaxID=182062 RepID=A0A8H5CLW2_9AGAR|nr:hypothetical protein D9758_008910 [Tetrapyrgos nigripes]